MRVFAGCAGQPVALLRSTCQQILDGLADYGQFSAQCHFPTVAIGYRERTPPSHQSNAVGQAADLVVVGDVRLDNRREIITALGGEGAAYSDLDLVARAWERWSDHAPARLIGDFAFAVWCQSKRQLTLVRDPTGERPLFYSLADTFVAFASMPAALSASISRQNRLDLGRLAGGLLGHSGPTESTSFTGVLRVLPGSVTTISSGVVRSFHYWQPPRDHLRLKDGEFADRYRSVLFEAVRRRSGESDRLGSQLSAGWDSSCVTAAAAQIGGNPIAFTAAPREGFCGAILKHRQADESALAALTARLHSIEHHIIRPTRGPLGTLRRHHRLYQEPERNIVNMEWWSGILRDAADRGVDTMLTGQMGNLSINAGGLSVLAEWLDHGHVARWLREARAARVSSTASWRGILYNSAGQRLPGWLADVLERYAGRAPGSDEQTFVRPDWHRPALGHARSTPVRDEGRRPYAARLAWIRGYDQGAFRVGGFGESGVEERDPLSDRELLEFSFQVPPDQLLSEGEWRPMARRALAGLVPDKVLDYPLRGYQGADWYERIAKPDLYALLEEVSGSRAASDLLDLGKIQATIDRWPAGGTDALSDTRLFRHKLLAALSVGTFIQEFEG